MTRLNPGDLVALNSGGPILTVIEAGVETAKVAWITEDGKKQEAIFPIVCLRGKSEKRSEDEG
jgi:uncharacterized protein YodC (DUF2158 family)